MYSYVLDGTLSWGYDSIQTGMGYLLLHLPHGSVLELAMYCVTVVSVSIMIGLAVLTCREMLLKGAVSSMWALKALRLLAALFATVFLFPAITILLSPMHAAQAHPDSAVYVLPDGPRTAGILLIALSGVLLPLFLTVTTSIYMFMFDPDPRSGRLMARASSAGEVLHTTLKVTIVLTNLFAPPLVFLSVLWIYTVLSLYGDWFHPLYYFDLPNLLRVGISTAHMVAASWTFWVYYNPQPEGERTAFMKMVIVSIGLGLVGIAGLAGKFMYQDPVRAIRSRLKAAGVAIRGDKSLAPGPASTMVYSSLAAAVTDNIHLLTPFHLGQLSRTTVAEQSVRRLLRYNEGFQLSSPMWSWLLPARLRAEAYEARAAGRAPNVASLFDMSDNDAGGNTLTTESAAASDGEGASDSLAYAEFASMLLQACLKVNPHSAALWVRYAALTALAQGEVDRATVRRLLSTAMAEKPGVELKYCLFFVAKHLQRSTFMAETGQQMDVLDLMRYQHDLRRARMHQNAVTRASYRFWRTVRAGAFATNNERPAVTSILAPVPTERGRRKSAASSAGGDGGGDDGKGVPVVAARAVALRGISLTMTLSDLAQEATQHEAMADMYYQRLIESFPASRAVLRMYATHVDTVKNEPAAAAAVLEYADQLDEEEGRRVAETIKSRVKRHSVAPAGTRRRNSHGHSHHHHATQLVSHIGGAGGGGGGGIRHLAGSTSAHGDHHSESMGPSPTPGPHTFRSSMPEAPRTSGGSAAGSAVVAKRVGGATLALPAAPTGSPMSPATRWMLPNGSSNDVSRDPLRSSSIGNVSFGTFAAGSGSGLPASPAAALADDPGSNSGGSGIGSAAGPPPVPAPAPAPAPPGMVVVTTAAPDDAAPAELGASGEGGEAEKPTASREITATRLRGSSRGGSSGGGSSSGSGTGGVSSDAASRRRLLPARAPADALGPVVIKGSLGTRSRRLSGSPPPPETLAAGEHPFGLPVDSTTAVEAEDAGVASYRGEGTEVDATQPRRRLRADSNEAADGSGDSMCDIQASPLMPLHVDTHGGGCMSAGGDIAAGEESASPVRFAPMRTTDDAAGSVAGKRSAGSMHDGGSVASGGRFSDLLSGGGLTDGNGGGSLMATISDTLAARITQQREHAVVSMTAAFSRSMRLTVILLVACVISLYITGVMLLGALSTEAAVVAQAGGTRRTTQEFVYYARQLEMASSGAVAGDAKAVVGWQGKLSKAASKLLNDTSSLYQRIYAYSRTNAVDAGSYDELMNVWTGQDSEVPVVLKMWDPYNRTAYYTPDSLTDMYARYIQAANALCAAPNSTFMTGAGKSPAMLANNLDLRFILDNGLTTVYEATWGLVTHHQRHYADGARSKSVAISIVLVVIIVLPAVLTLLVFVPAYRRIKRDRTAAYHLFLALPGGIIDDMMARFDGGGGNKRGDHTTTTIAAVLAPPTSAPAGPLPRGRSDGGDGGGASGGKTIAALRVSRSSTAAAALAASGVALHPHRMPTGMQTTVTGEMGSGPVVSAGSVRASNGVTSGTIDLLTGALHTRSSPPTLPSGASRIVSFSVDGSEAPGRSSIGGGGGMSSGIGGAVSVSPAPEDMVGMGGLDTIAEDAEAEAAHNKYQIITTDGPDGSPTVIAVAPSANGGTGRAATPPDADDDDDGAPDTRETAQLRRVVLPYMASVTAILAFGMALAGILLTTNALLGTRALEVNFSGARRSQSFRLMVLAQELIRNDTTTWSSSAPIRSRMTTESAFVAQLEQGVLNGDTSLALPGLLGRYQQQW